MGSQGPFSDRRTCGVFILLPHEASVWHLRGLRGAGPVARCAICTCFAACTASGALGEGYLIIPGMSMGA